MNESCSFGNSNLHKSNNLYKLSELFRLLAFNKVKRERDIEIYFVISQFWVHKGWPLIQIEVQPICNNVIIKYYSFSWIWNQLQKRTIHLTNCIKLQVSRFFFPKYFFPFFNWKNSKILSRRFSTRDQLNMMSSHL